MTGFIVGALLLAGLVLALVLPALLRRRPERSTAVRDELNAAIYRDQLRELDNDLAAGILGAAAHGQARLELQRRLLEDADEPHRETPAPEARRSGLTAGVIGVMVPLAAVGLYVLLGTPAALSPDARAPVTQEQVVGMVEKLRARLEQKPDDAKGWLMLARSYLVLGRYAEAVGAFERAGAVVDADASLLAQYAEALARAADGKLAGKPAATVERALKIDPDNVHALVLAGGAAFEKEDYAGAISYWERVQSRLPQGSDEGQALGASIARAREASTGAATAVRGVVTLGPGLGDKVAPEDTVYVLARSIDGARMPLAVVRARVADLPFSYTLDDSTAMSPAATLSAAGEVRVEARVSRSGEPGLKPGDLHGASGAVKPGSRDVRVVIDQVVK